MTILKEKKITSELVFDGKFLKVYSDIVMLPNGKKGTREWIDHPGAVCCIPIINNNKIIMVKQYRYPLKSQFFELPAGKLDAGESPSDCAIRELEEETGFKANKLTFLSTIHPAIGFANEKMWLCLAENLHQTQQNLDKDEFLETIILDLNEAIMMIWNQEITDVKTIIGLLWAERILKKRKISD